MVGAERRGDVLVSVIRWWREHVHRHTWAHALMATVFLASLTVLLEDSALAWLDVTMLRIVPEIDRSGTLNALLGPILSRVGWRSPSFSRTPSDQSLNVLVLTIERPYFDNEFGSRSPIPRREFLKLLNTVKAVFFDKGVPNGVRPPSVLAIDYDLSPNPKAPAEDRKWQKSLDAFLTEFASATRGSDPHRTVLLIHHLPDFNEKSCENRRRWETSMQARRVRFGRPELVHHALFDSVVEYESKVDRFASQLTAAALDGGAIPIEFECRRPDEDRKDAEPSGHESKPKPINFLGAAESVHVCPLEALSDVTDLCASFLGWGPPSGRGKTPREFQAVVVGAGYDERDIFLTPLGQRSGAVLHAYIAYSMRAGLATHRPAAFALDCLIGVSAGLLLYPIWLRYHRQARMERRLALALLSFCVIATFGVFLMILAPLLMQRGMWLNPAPMLLGLLIDSWFNSVITAEAARSERHSPLSWWTIWAYVSWMFFVAAALVSLFFREDLGWWSLLGGWALVSLFVSAYAGFHPSTRFADEHPHA